MKAEAPEKIYVQPNAHDRWFEGKIPSGLHNGLFVEYARTDDFIEKVARFLENKLYDRIEIQVFGTVIPSLTSKKAFIDELKKYMKGE